MVQHRLLLLLLLLFSFLLPVQGWELGMCINNKHKLAEKIKEKRVAGGTLEEMYVNLWALGVPTT